MSNIELIQIHDTNIEFSIKNPKIDGYYIKTLEQHMLENMDKDDVSNILNNAYKVLPYLIDPELEGKKTNKILCLGKVQSGKTGFFISSIALAFDNGYKLAYVIGGTKTKLKNQNLERLENEFSNNPKVKVLDVNNATEDILNLINNDYKVILVALKNVTSSQSNLGMLDSLTKESSYIPSIVIDDEGDECSPGAPKLKSKSSKAGKTHDVLSDILDNIDLSTFLSVTATPQANLLISTIDKLSPDYAVLVEPGKNYIGGNNFHDIYDNPHVIEIDDSDDFETSMPESFKDAIYFYIFSILVHLYRGDSRPFSMLVHPSSLNIVQSMVADKIKQFCNTFFNNLSNTMSLSYDNYLSNIYESGKSTVNDFIDFPDFKSKVNKYITEVLSNIEVYEFNVSRSGRESINSCETNTMKYKIYVGGNMLGRGLTIKNLNVTYIYRDSKITQIDTLYQRARWFGYKKDYFDLCRVYMTSDLKYKFIDTVESENDLWTAMNEFLYTKINIKKFPRIFTLNNDKLRLTRGSVSKTVKIGRISQGFKYDTTIKLTPSEIKKNRELLECLFNDYKDKGKPIKFGKNDIQTHYVIPFKYSEFYHLFLSKFNYPVGSKFSKLVFEKLLTQVHEGLIEDKISLVIMRYKDGEFRSAIMNNYGIKELPQSYDYNTEYPGDKFLTGLKDIFHLQVHKVYIDKTNKEEYIPVLALNNPLSRHYIKIVTGDNFYE